LNEAAPARLHGTAKSLNVLTASRAEFAAARARSRTVGLRSGPKHSKKHYYAEKPVGDSVYHHLGTLPEYRTIVANEEPFCLRVLLMVTS
jgi:hypothetical protein